MLFNIWFWVNWISICERMKLDLYLTSNTKISSKWNKDLNISSKSIKLLEANVVEKLYDIGFGNDFLDMTPKAQTTKEKIDKLDFIKLENFGASKNTMKRVIKQLTEWKKVFANHLSDKGLVSRIYKELLQLNNNQKTTQLKNGQQTWIYISPFLTFLAILIFSPLWYSSSYDKQYGVCASYQFIAFWLQIHPSLLAVQKLELDHLSIFFFTSWHNVGLCQVRGSGE